ncbi:MAG: universal stress protein [Acidimicrobiia bacterium]|nr:universal stress protein [Acidimicrobiia bacterium]
MHILVATDGTLPSEQVVETVARWYEDGDTVTVFTAMNVPTDFLRRLGDTGVEDAARIAKEAGATLMAGDKAAQQLTGSVGARKPAKSDSPVLHALMSTARSRTKPVVDGLKEQGITAKQNWRTSEYKTASTTLAFAKEEGADVLVIGSHGHGKYEGLLGSTGTKLVRSFPGTTIVIRARD